MNDVTSEGRPVSNWLALLAALALVSGCGEPPEPPEQEVLRPVRVFEVPADQGVRTRSFSGISQSTQESRMSFQVAGTLVELPVQVGDNLKAGDLIARLNPSTFDLTVQQSEASLAQALANERNAEANYRRVKELYENTNASRNDLDSARASAESARAQVRSARKSLEIAELNRSYADLTAASDCTVATLEVDLNENVRTGDPVARVNCGAGIEVRIGVPESLIGGLQPGMDATVRFNAINNLRFQAKVSELAAASSGSSATFPVVVALTESSPQVRPGMAAEVTFQFSSPLSSDVRVIPVSALINDESGTYVFIAVPGTSETSTIERRPVSIGDLTTGGVQILDGLAVGDRVVTAGTSVIRNGQTVITPEI